MSSIQSSIDEIYWQAMQIASDQQRRLYLDASCGRDSELRRRVETLLQARTQADRFWQPAESAAWEPANQHDAEQLIGSTTGPYTLCELIGQGGMGIVFAADQVGPIRRRVAFKLLKPGLVGSNIIDRFEAERQSLAVMDHPGIAKVFDAGTTESGQPYFVMELVHGERLTRYCESNRLPLRERLRLFARVCDAVIHAHQKGIIHRDLKPSNILVNTHDGQAAPKIIDFGIAKAAEDLTDRTVETGIHEIVGTPMYMSPEQATYHAKDIDTRTDVYSLGVVLYQLLTGTTPFDRQLIRTAPFAEMFRILREEIPPRPSVRVTEGESPPEYSKSQKDARRLLSGELDWIVMKAMEKDRGRRYQSVAEFKEDVERFLANREVQARPPSLPYRLQKTYSRNRTLVTGLAMMVLTLIAGIVATSWQAHRAHLATKKAEDRTAQAVAAEKSAGKARRDAVAARKEAEWQLYLADMKQASDAFADGDIPRVRDLLERHRTDPWSQDRFEWAFLNRMTTADSPWQKQLSSSIRRIRLSPAGDRIAVVTRGTGIHICNARTGSIERSLSVLAECNSVAWAPDADRLVVACADGMVRVFDLPAGPDQSVRRLLKNSALPIPDSPDEQFILHQGEVNDVLFSPDGNSLITCADDAKIKICDSGTGEVQATFDGHEREVEQLAITPDGTRIASASSDHTLRVWNLKTLEQEHRWLGQPESARMVAVDLSPDGSLVAAADIGGCITVADLRTGRSWCGHQVDGIESLSFAGTNGTLVTGDRGGAIRIWDVAASDELGVRLTVDRQWKVSDLTVGGLAFGVNAGLVYSGSRDGTLSAWYLPETGVSWLHRESREVGLTESDELLSYGKELYVVDPDRRRILHAAVPQTDSSVRGYSLQCGHRVLTEADGCLQIFDRGKRCVTDSWEYPGNVRHAAISPDGSLVAAADETERRLVDVYRSGETEPILRLPAPQCNHLLFSDDGRLLVVSAMDDVLVFDTQTGQRTHHLQAHQSTVTHTSFNPDETKLVSVGHDRRMVIWDVATAQPRMAVVAHRDQIRGVDWSPDGLTIATTGRDNFMRLWDAASAQPIFQMPLPDAGEKVLFAGNNRLVVSTRDHGLAVLGHNFSDRSGDSPDDVVQTRTEQTARLILMPENPGVSRTQPTDISENGSVVTGNARTDEKYRAYRWEVDVDFQLLPQAFNLKQSRQPLVSAEGNIVSGSLVKPNGHWVFHRWSDSDRPFQTPAAFSVLSSAILRDANVDQFVGHGFAKGHSSKRLAWHFDGQELRVLPGPAEDSHQAADAITADGAMIVGIAWSGSKTSRSNAVSDLRVVRWINGQYTEIPELRGQGYNWRSRGMSRDGAVIVGHRWPVGTTPLQAETDYRLGFRWDNGQVTLLGRIHEDRIHTAINGVSADGRVIVGESRSSGGVEAVIWDEPHGLRRLQDVAVENGANHTDLNLIAATAVSSDGTTIAGIAVDQSGRIRSFVLRLPAAAFEQAAEPNVD